MPIEIQPVRAADVEAIALLAREIWQSAYAGIISQDQIDYMLAQRYNSERLLAELAQSGLWWDQAFIDGERAGFCSCYLTDQSGEIKLDKVYVHPGRQRSGIGAALIERVLAHGRDHGCHTLVLAVNKQNSKAIAAYEKSGFSVRDAVRVDIGGGFVMDDFIMTRSIPGLPKANAMKLKFSKMHGLGNDFVVLDGVRQSLTLTPEQLRHLADRHFGVGCDQILLVEPAAQPGVDFRYRIFNADGGEVEQCGNGARCFVRFVHDHGLTDKREIRVETMSGVIGPRLEADGLVTVDMGVPVFEPEKIPFVSPSAEMVQPLMVRDRDVMITAVSMGNPHAVQVVADVDEAPVAKDGPLIETHPRFPQRVNAGFMQILDRHAIRLRVHERGAGETLACGTGACAAAVTGVVRGLVDSPVRVETRGGDLSISWAGAGTPVLMTGPAVTVFSGEIDL
jgi:diaminopimelate epimerase